jgi:hypothetical protein
MSIREYPEHYYYIDMYSNSADSMCILDPNAVVVDCNGATLRMLQIRTRSDLIDSCLLEELATDDGVPECTELVNRLGRVRALRQDIMKKRGW